MKTNVVLLGMAIVAAPVLSVPPAHASTLINLNLPAMAAHNSQGYLGVGLREVAEDQMNSFHVPAARGLEVVVVDHDAPAAKAGLKEHDIILRCNGEAVESVEKFRRTVRETPPGHLLALIISRDGIESTIPVKVADRAEVEKQAWAQHMEVIPESDMDMSMVAPKTFGRTVPGSGFFATITTPSYYTGVIVDALGPQLASFFGAQTGLGLLVKSVDANSPASIAGIKAGDVITKVGQTQMATRSDFYKAVRENKGKQVTVTLLRDKKEQTVTLNVDGKNTKSCIDRQDLPDMVEIQNMIEDANPVELAELQPQITDALMGLQDSINLHGLEVQSEINQKTMEQLKKLEPQMQEQLKKLEPQMREQMKMLQDQLPKMQEQMKLVEPQLREQMEKLQIEPKIQLQMKEIEPQIKLQMDEIEPQIQEQMLQLKTIEPEIHLKLDQLKTLEPQLQEQMKQLKLQMDVTPLV